MSLTTVALKPDTKEELRRLGEKGESYDTIIHRLLKETQLKQHDRRWNAILDHDDFIPLDEL